MSGDVLIVGVVVLAASAGLLVIGVLGHRDGVPRNRWIGVRTPSTMRSDEAWFAAQRASSPFMVVGGALGVAAAMFWLVMSPEEGDDASWALILVIVVVLALPGLLGAFAGVRAARKIGGDRDQGLNAGP